MSHKWQQSEQKDPNIYCVCTVKGPTDQQTMCAPVVQSATQPNMTLLQKTFNKTHIYCCNFRSDTIPLSFCSITSENYDIKKTATTATTTTTFPCDAIFLCIKKNVHQTLCYLNIKYPAAGDTSKKINIFLPLRSVQCIRGCATCNATQQTLDNFNQY